MTTLRGALSLCWIGALSMCAACSNGSGSVKEAEAQETGSGFSVGGTVTGLDGAGLSLRNNGVDDLTVTANGGFAFNTLLPSGSPYNVTVASQPTGSGQTCAVANGSGQVGSANVTNVTVTCATGAFAVRGVVTGLAGPGLVLHNNGGDPLSISANGEFVFPAVMPGGAPYAVTVATQPTNPPQTCSVTNGSGVIANADVANVRVTCSTANLSVGGSVSGLVGSGLVLQNNGADDLTINGDGPFVFAARLASGATYNVTVRSQPSSPAQNCAVRNASGRLAGANVTNVAVSCAQNRFTIGGAVSGLSGSGLRLALNDQQSLDIVSNGAFAFEESVPNGTAYRVSVVRQPRDPAQTCTASNESGAVSGANVTNIAVSCVTRTFQIGGSVTGLEGDGLVLRLNDAEDLAIRSNGSFQFNATLESGSAYRVAIASQPANPTQVCSLSNASGAVGGSDVSNVRVACASGAFSVGGVVSGLIGSGLVLQNNGGDDLSVNENGPFRFSRELAQGSQYNVTVRTQPSNPAQTCTVSRGSGAVDADVDDVEVRCSSSEFTVGGEVRDLSGGRLVLRNNGVDELVINSNGRFTFGDTLPTGAQYNVAVAVQPTDPAQTCTVSNGSGVIGTRNVSDVRVDCASAGFRIGGRVEDLRGSGLVLQNNGADDLPIASNGRFTFPTPLPTGAPYNVTVARQPTDPEQRCEVRDGSGRVRDEDVDDVKVRCKGDDDDDDDD